MDFQQVGLDGAAQASGGYGGGSETVERKNMGLELIYTSAKKGLKPGSLGFCTVAMSRQMSPTLAATLESLSGYRHLYTAGTGDYAENPVNFCHYLVPDRGRVARVLARIGAAPADYTGRTNKLAHFIALDSAELPLAGPAWLLGRPGLMQEVWQGEPRWIESPITIPNGDSPAGQCAAWQRVTGDAGWAGGLLRRFCESPDAPVHLICNQGTPALELFAEAMALLPAEVRWQIAFSTYFTGMPAAGVKCHWRGIIAGTAAGAVDPKSVVDLTHPLGQAPDDVYSAAAREGRIVNLSAMRSPVIAGETPITLATGPELSPWKAVGAKPVDVGVLELAPQDARPRATRFFHPHNVDQADAQRNLRRGKRWIFPVVLAVAAFVVVAALGAWFLLSRLGSAGQLDRAILVTAVPGRPSPTNPTVPAKPLAQGPKTVAPGNAKVTVGAKGKAMAAPATEKVNTMKKNVPTKSITPAEKAVKARVIAQAKFLAKSRKPLKVLNEPIFESTGSGLGSVGPSTTSKGARIEGIKNFLVRFPPKSSRGGWSLNVGKENMLVKPMKTPCVLPVVRPSNLDYSMWWVPDSNSGAGDLVIGSSRHRLRCTMVIPEHRNSLTVRAVDLDRNERYFPREMVVDVQLANGRKERLQFLPTAEISLKHLNRPKVILLNPKTPAAAKITPSLKSATQLCLTKESLHPKNLAANDHPANDKKSFTINLAPSPFKGAKRRVLKFNVAHGRIHNNFSEIRRALHIRLGHWKEKVKEETDALNKDITWENKWMQSHPSKKRKKGAHLNPFKKSVRHDRRHLSWLSARQAHVVGELGKLNSLKSITFHIDLYPGGPVLERFKFKKGVVK